MSPLRFAFIIATANWLPSPRCNPPAATAHWIWPGPRSRLHGKTEGDGGWINGGFFVLSPECVQYIDGDATHWEAEPLTRLAQQGQLMAFEHAGFWQPMDTLRDKNQLEELWQSGGAPWKVWHES